MWQGIKIFQELNKAIIKSKEQVCRGINQFGNPHISTSTHKCKSKLEYNLNYLHLNTYKLKWIQEYPNQFGWSISAQKTSPEIRLRVYFILGKKKKDPSRPPARWIGSPTEQIKICQVFNESPGSRSKKPQCTLEVGQDHPRDRASGKWGWTWILSRSIRLQWRKWESNGCEI